jgi:hypothetical protein
MIRLIPILIFVISAIMKAKIPNGRPKRLPAIIRFNIAKSISFLIFVIKANDITKDKIKFICTASIGLKISRRNGVAKIENPNPVLVCRMEAVSMIRKYNENSTLAPTLLRKNHLHKGYYSIVSNEINTS